MKINNLSFPHPVLGVNDDVQGKFAVNCMINLDQREISLTLQCSLENNTLQEIIEEKKAYFMAEVECAQTIFRNSYYSFDSDYTISIPAQMLRNKVSVKFYICASDSIPEYQNKNANIDYEGFTFDIAKGDILAFGGSLDFLALKDWQALQAVSSFMTLEPYDGQIMEIIPTSKKIVVHVPKEDFDRYIELKSVRDFASIFHASIVFPVLIVILQELSQLSDYEDDWAIFLDDRIQHDDQLTILFEDKKFIELGQQILGLPIRREMEALMNIKTVLSKEVE